LGEALHIPKYKEVIPYNWDLYNGIHTGYYNAVDMNDEDTYELD
jgi:hypothetical protein